MACFENQLIAIGSRRSVVQRLLTAQKTGQCRLPFLTSHGTANVGQWHSRSMQSGSRRWMAWGGRRRDRRWCREFFWFSGAFLPWVTLKHLKTTHNNRYTWLTPWHISYITPATKDDMATKQRIAQLKFLEVVWTLNPCWSSSWWVNKIHLRC